MAQSTSTENEGMLSEGTHESAPLTKEKFPCDRCDKSFPKKDKLNRHRRTHTGEKPYPCTHCGKAFARNDNFRRHVRTQTEGGPYQCTECGETFASKCTLSPHKFTHVGENPPKCTVCGKTFRCNSALNRHIMTHTAEKPFKCDYCEKSFNRKGNLKYHKQRMHEKYGCKLCKRPFSMFSRFKKHMQIHISLKMLYVNQCKYQLSQRFDFKEMRKCENCGLIFLFTNALRCHSALHFGKKHSVYRYRRKVYRVHTVKVPYKCRLCSKNFYVPSNFNKHIKSHGEENN